MAPVDSGPAVQPLQLRARLQLQRRPIQHIYRPFVRGSLAQAVLQALNDFLHASLHQYLRELLPGLAIPTRRARDVMFPRALALTQNAVESPRRQLVHHIGQTPIPTQSLHNHQPEHDPRRIDSRPFRQPHVSLQQTE